MELHTLPKCHATISLRRSWNIKSSIHRGITNVAIQPPKWPIITKQGDTTYGETLLVKFTRGHLTLQEIHTMTSILQPGLSPCESRHKYLSFVGEFVSKLWLKYLDTLWCKPPDMLCIKLMLIYIVFGILG